MSSDAEQQFVDTGPEFEYTIPPRDMERKWPHDIGLSPLDCANPDCHADEIYKYPCPECDRGAPSPEQLREADHDNLQSTWGDWTNDE